MKIRDALVCQILHLHKKASKSPEVTGFWIMFQNRTHWHSWNFWYNAGQVSSKAGPNTSFMWNLCGTQLALAGSHLEFHIQTNPKFQSKIKGEGKQRNRPTNSATMTKPRKDGFLENRRAVIFQTHFILAPLDSATKLVLLQHSFALRYAKSRLSSNKGEKILGPQKPQEAVKHVLKITRRFKILAVRRNEMMTILLRMQIWKGRGSNSTSDFWKLKEEADWTPLGFPTKFKF